MSPRVLHQKLIKESESTVYALDLRKLMQAPVQKMCAKHRPQAQQGLRKLSRIMQTHVYNLL